MKLQSKLQIEEGKYYISLISTSKRKEGEILKVEYHRNTSLGVGNKRVGGYLTGYTTSDGIFAESFSFEKTVKELRQIT